MTGFWSLIQRFLFSEASAEDAIKRQPGSAAGRNTPASMHRQRQTKAQGPLVQQRNPTAEDKTRHIP